MIELTSMESFMVLIAAAFIGCILAMGATLLFVSGLKNDCEEDRAR